MRSPLIPEFHRRFPEWSFDSADKVSADRVTALPCVKSEVEIWKDRIGLLNLSRIGDPRDNVYRLRFGDQIAVDILLDDKTLIEIAVAPDLPLSTREHFLVDQVLPRMLAHDGRLVLHASAVRVDDKSLVMLGKSGSGKSTLCTSLDQAGHGLIGDDAMVVSSVSAKPYVAAVYPSLRLLPDSISQFFPATVATTAVAHYTDKQRVRLPSPAQGEELPVGVRAIFLIDGSPDTGEVETRPLSVAATCMALIENSFMLDPTDVGRVRNRLAAASELARQVPSFALRYPRDYSRLGEVREAILNAIRGS